MTATLAAAQRPGNDELMLPLVPYVRRRDWPMHDELLELLRRAMPDAVVTPYAEIDPSQLDGVRVAIVDGPSADQLASMPNLEFVQSTWAGVEKILPIVPKGVAIARMIDPQLGATMAEAVLAWTLYLHRDMPTYARQQRARKWSPLDPVKAAHRRIGVLGLGELGAQAATTLAGQGFDVAGWSRSAKSIDGVTCVHGRSRLREMLGRSDIVVNLLPETTVTSGMLDADAFASMPTGSSFVNFGRGTTVDDDALLAALDAGHLAHAVLDVFTTEPLPDDHHYWTHESVTVLPHISGPTSADTAAVIATSNVRDFLTNGTLPDDAVVDRTRGY